MTKHQRQARLNELASQYDLFLTAMDFAMAELAESVGLQTIIYDALTWYWPVIPPAVKNAELYIAQRFFGVAERLEAEAGAFPAYALVPPIVIANKGREKRHILLNMGGLQNPFWNSNDAIAYAKLMLEAVSAAMPEGQTLVVATSAAIAAALDDPRVVTFSHRSIIEAFRKAQVAIMTSGLGNIYDAASFDVPTLWLPPANDSQGQQAELLEKHGCSDERLDWCELSGPIDYTAPQTAVLQEITAALRSITESEALRRKLTAATAQKLQALGAYTGSKTTHLLRLFGANGARNICDTIIELLERGAHVRTE
ncbi:MAG TPA: hypothetical protein VLF91_00740 [Candidatus Saccharimonadales bacterium]|nr:hypothetical protein [Candidatus Saccharimonadales bacterium]